MDSVDVLVMGRNTYEAVLGFGQWPYGGKKVGQESLSRAQGFGFGRADQPLLADFEPFHKGDGGGTINTLFADLKARTARPLDGR